MWNFSSESVIIGEGENAKFYDVSFCNGKAISVMVSMDRHWKSRAHFRTVWRDDRKPGKKVVAIIAEAKANIEKRKSEKNE
jgi:hypothetical protein